MGLDGVGTCGNCRFWKPGEGEEGRCRRRAPLQGCRFSTAGHMELWFPPTFPDDWCGEWEPVLGRERVMPVNAPEVLAARKVEALQGPENSGN